ncbi:MAG: HEPN domain-containing protein [Candidatus Goldbacteria bacterium]|nr:HEPN domain-containing protein [Candidatus Goldiibacteriota bacterium]
MNKKNSLYVYRLKQSEETFKEVEKMVKEKFSSRTIINRAYYAMFYLLLALFIRNNIEVNTSKHTGIISIFDNAFIKTGKIDKKYSKILHSIFNERQIGD